MQTGNSPTRLCAGGGRARFEMVLQHCRRNEILGTDTVQTFNLRGPPSSFAVQTLPTKSSPRLAALAWRMASHVATFLRPSSDGRCDGRRAENFPHKTHRALSTTMDEAPPLQCTKFR